MNILLKLIIKSKQKTNKSLAIFHFLACSKIYLFCTHFQCGSEPTELNINPETAEQLRASFSFQRHGQLQPHFFASRETPLMHEHLS